MTKHIQTLTGPIDPGIYIADAGTQAYAVLQSAVTAREVRFVGERWSERGVHQLAVEVGNKKGVASEGRILEGKGLRSNPQVGIGAQFFATALKTYRNWEEAWWREVVQNSVDAGATRVELRVDEVGGAIVCTCEDNGGGMSRDVLLDKFLVLGGSTKGEGGSTGGFGKAKELIILPWLSWEIHTRGVLVSGQNINYEVANVHHLSGTRVSVTMPADNATTLEIAAAFVAKCWLPQTRFTFKRNGVVNEALTAGSQGKLAPDEPLREVEDKAYLAFARGHKTKQLFDSMMLIRAMNAERTRSLFMWSQWVPEGVKGQLLCEITAPTIDLLNDNRQSWRNYRLENAMSKFVSELSADTKSALKKHKVERFKYEGEKFQAKADRVQSEVEFVALGQSKVPEGKTLTSETQKKIVEVLGEIFGTSDGQSEGGAFTFSPSAASAEAILESVTLKGREQIESISKQLSWTPAFYLHSSIEGYTIPKKFKPEGMSSNMRKLARFWAELCRMVLCQLGSTQPYGIGFLFDNDHDRAGAMCLTDSDGAWLLLNPFSDREMETLLSVTSKDDLKWLLAASIHECTHMANGVSLHNEAFASAMTQNMAKCAHLFDALPAIKRVVYAEERTTKKEPKAKKYVPRDDDPIEAEPHQWEVLSVGFVDIGFYVLFAKQARGSLKYQLEFWTDDGALHVFNDEQLQPFQKGSALRPDVFVNDYLQSSGQGLHRPFRILDDQTYKVLNQRWRQVNGVNDIWAEGVRDAMGDWNR